MINGNNKIIKNNSIRVYSSAIINEFSDLAKKEKLKKYNELTKEIDNEINKKKDIEKLNSCIKGVAPTNKLFKNIFN